MSYDLMVFAPEAAPAKRPAFIDWYDRETDWNADHDYDDPARATPALRAFYADMAAEFAPLAIESDDDSGTEYTIAPSLIYMSFYDWDRVDEAHGAVTRLAGKHGLGFFDVSSDLAEAWLPDGKGGLRLAHSD
jgi:hypothetical protein